jgi:HPr kinase/phosphorylase
MSADGGASGMTRQVSVDRFFADNQSRLGLSWDAGRQGGNRVLTGDAALKPTIGQVGHMNFIHPFRIQILGAAELAYLRGLPQDQMHASIQRLFTLELAAIVVGNGEPVPERLVEQCNNHNIALFASPQPSPHLVDMFRLYLSRVLAESTTLHGVFLDVLEMGVLITGASAIGKSELALELISRGNGLVADDIVELYRISPDTIEGRCPAVLRDFLEVRGIGVLNIRTIFGETAIRPRKLLRLIVHLEDHSHETFTELDRADSPAVGVINRSLADQFWSEADPVGQRVSLDNGQSWTTIVGVVGDVREQTLDSAPEGAIYVPQAQSFWAGTLVLRTP